MPTSIVKTEREEEKWKKAKQLAKDQGHEGDWGYVMGIYKRMNPDKFTKEAHPYLIMEILRGAMWLP